jgi:hypothetical protein
MKLNLNEIIAAVNSYNKVKDEKLSLKTAYRLSKLFDELSKEATRYDDLVRNALLKYAKKDENGNPIFKQTERGESVEVLPEDQDKFMDEIEELNKNEIEIEDCFFTLGDFGNISISLEEIKGLLPFIKED